MSCVAVFGRDSGRNSATAQVGSVEHGSGASLRHSSNACIALMERFQDLASGFVAWSWQTKLSLSPGHTTIYQSIYLFVCLSVYLSICLSVCLSICLSICVCKACPPRLISKFDNCKCDIHIVQRWRVAVERVMMQPPAHLV